MQMSTEQLRPPYTGRAFTARHDGGPDRPDDPAGRVIAMLADEYGAQVVLDRACELLAAHGGTPDEVAYLQARLDRTEQERATMTAERDQWRADYAELARQIAAVATITVTES